MSTMQKQIRDAVVALVTTASGLPTTSIFRAPRREIPVSCMPAIAIYSKNDTPENVDADQMQPHVRIYTITVEIRASARPEEDATDALAIAIRRALLAEDSLGGPALRTIWTNQIWDGAEDENPLAGTALDFAIHYRWRPE